MALKTIHVEGFKSIRSLELDLKRLNVLIGPNGAGKSNFISLFRLLHEMVEGRLQLAVGRGGGADAFLYFGQRTTDRLYVHLWFGRNEYDCTLEPTVDDSLVFSNEHVYYLGQNYSTPLNYSIGAGHQESKLRTVAKLKTEKIAWYVLEEMRTWRVYHFHDTSDAAGIKKMCDINDNQFLRSDAGNLAAFLYRLQHTHTRYYDRIVATIRQAAPFFDDFLLRPSVENDTKMRLEWRETESDFPFLAHYLSDGTLRFMCLATVLLQPNPPSTILIDEPELGLHPYALSVLAGLIKGAALKTQLIISTQSVALIDYFDPQDLLIVERDDHSTTIKRVEPDRLREWLDEYSLGELWEKNVLGGRP